MAHLTSRRQLLRLALGGIGALLPVHFGSSRAASGQAAPLRLLLVGDAGSGDAPQLAVAEQMGRWHHHHPVDLVLLAGDNLYARDGHPDGSAALLDVCFHRPYRDLLGAGVPFHAVLGNHDIISADGAPQLAEPALGMGGRRWYSLRREDTQLFLLDTNPGGRWQHQLPWLRRQLAASTARWKLVMGHHPLYSSGLYGDDPQLIDRLEPLLRRHGVQIYIHGHEHHYERSLPIGGVTHLCVGGGGAPLRPVLAGDRTARALSRHSFAAVEVAADQLTITALDLHGERIDQASIDPGGRLLS